MIKGHAIIELKNKETGEVQRVEHDNMITNGLKYCLTPWLGKFSYANTKTAQFQYTVNENKESRKTGNASIMNHLLGGIFLFQNPLEENVDNVAFPLDNPLTGKASYDAYNGIDTYRGSYNESESGLQEDGSYKHVWDFGTNQANGQVGALALTTYKGGICGCGFKEWNIGTEEAISESPFFELGSIAISAVAGSNFCAFIDPIQNDIYYSEDRYNTDYNPQYADRHLSSTQKLFLKKKKFPLCQMSPFYDYYNQYLETEIELAVPEEFALYAEKTNIYGETADNHLYVYKEQVIKPEEIFQLWRVKKSDMTSDVISITNTTAYNLQAKVDKVCFTDRYCFLFGDGPIGEGYIYRIDLDNNDITQVKDPEPEYYSYFMLKIINGFLYVSNYGGIKKCFCINTETLETRYHPVFSWGPSSSRPADVNIERITPNIFLWYRKNPDAPTQKGLANINILANTLMTINNLSSPIVKTAAQTMKITYTIQETE